MMVYYKVEFSAVVIIVLTASPCRCVQLHRLYTLSAFVPRGLM